MKRRWGSKMDGQGGNSLVELALFLPVLVTILLGTIDFGRVLYAKVAIVNAARVGAEHAARVGAEPNVTDTELQTIVKEIVIGEAKPYLVLQEADIAVQRQPAPWNPSKIDTTVTVTYQFKPVAPFTERFWGGGSELTIRATTVTRQE